MKTNVFVICAANAFVVFQMVEDIYCVRPGSTGAIRCRLFGPLPLF